MALISICCYPSNFCIPNGLCLNTGGNSLLSIQGCADKNLGSLCVKYCASNGTSCHACIVACRVLINSRISLDATSSPVFTTPALAQIQHNCCGPNQTACCSNGEGVGSIILHTNRMSTHTPASPSASSSITPTITIRTSPIHCFNRRLLVERWMSHSVRPSKVFGLEDVVELKEGVKIAILG